jgi:hypothetical protein
LGVRSTAAPPLVFILCGLALGPFGANLLSPAVLDRLDVVVSVALAILGVFVGLGLTGIPSRSMGSAVAGGVAASAITIVVVASGLFLMAANWGMRLPLEPLAFATVIGVCSSVSAAAHAGGRRYDRAVHVADLDDLPLVLIGAILIAVLGDAGRGSAMLRLGATAAAGAAIGVAGWLLFERAAGAAERGVFVTGAMLLLAGAGAYLGTSPLLSGLIAALVWVRAPGVADRITAADLRTLQHPLVALLLVVAGALLEWSAAVLWLAAAVVVLRLLGKLAASVTVARFLHVPPALLATVLLPPGVMGIALALNVRQALGGEAAGLVAVVTMAGGATEVLAAFLPRDLEAGR